MNDIRVYEYTDHANAIFRTGPQAPCWKSLFWR